MASFEKMKPRRASSLGEPPSLEEASANLQAPEIAPAKAAAERKLARPEQSTAAQRGAGRRDGRTARKTGRTIQFATRVTPEFHEQLRDIAEAEERLLVEVLEDALKAYTASKRK